LFAVGKLLASLLLCIYTINYQTPAVGTAMI